MVLDLDHTDFFGVVFLIWQTHCRFSPAIYNSVFLSHLVIALPDLVISLILVYVRTSSFSPWQISSCRIS